MSALTAGLPAVANSDAPPAPRQPTVYTPSPDVRGLDNVKTGLVAGGASQGAATGTSREELVTALTTGARKLLFGKHTNELARILPKEDPDQVLVLAAECRLMSSHGVVEALAHAIHHRAHLMPEARAALHLALAELIANAVEHGNLGLSSERKGMVSEQQWFDAYHKRVSQALESPLGRIPLLVVCRRIGADLEVVIEDRGLGFNVRQVKEALQHENTHTGRGLGLVFALMENRVAYDSGGRRVTFKLPVRPRAEHTLLPTREQARNRGRVMVVDDEQVNLRVVEKAFVGAGFKHINTCKDPLIALEQMRIFKPDLVLLDVMMPKIDGYALCAQMKADAMLRDVPVIFFTGLSDADSRTRGFKLGAVDFASKPIEPAELIARSESHLMNGMMTRALQGFAERSGADLERARSFQYDLLPSPSSLTQVMQRHDLEVATVYQGCESLAGDYWNILSLDEHQVAICLVDFTGHGVLAALNTVQLHTLLHNQKPLLGKPVLMAQSLNYNLSQLLGGGSFATFMYGVLDTKSGEFSYAGGGAPPLLVRKKDGTLKSLACDGLPLGLGPEIEVLPRRAVLEKGDTLLLISDAMMDAVHSNGRRWSVEGVEQAVRAAPTGMNATQVVNFVLDRFYATVNLPVEDDLTMLAITLGRDEEVKKA
ncbi:MAG: SpoIIE family protein phosphatase [Proteobacteria bacterium]|nr:SpoIIE family protein phosphatase [Pseudomonadota bacterium]